MLYQSTNEQTAAGVPHTSCWCIRLQRTRESVQGLLTEAAEPIPALKGYSRAWKSRLKSSRPVSLAIFAGLHSVTHVPFSERTSCLVKESGGEEKEEEEDRRRGGGTERDNSNWGKMGGEYKVGEGIICIRGGERRAENGIL